MSQYLIYTYGTSPTMFMSLIETTESINNVLVTDVWSFGGLAEPSSFDYSSDLDGFNILANLDHPLTLAEAQLLYPELFI